MFYDKEEVNNIVFFQGMKLYRRIPAFLHHVDLMHNASQMDNNQAAHALPTISVLHPIVDLSVSSHLTAPAIWRVSTNVVAIHVPGLVAYQANAMCTITILSVHANIII